jgi:hypothetical protein
MDWNNLVSSILHLPRPCSAIEKLQINCPANSQQQGRPCRPVRHTNASRVADLGVFAL